MAGVYVCNLYPVVQNPARKLEVGSRELYAVLDGAPSSSSPQARFMGSASEAGQTLGRRAPHCRSGV
jgi:hypothetical protein